MKVVAYYRVSTVAQGRSGLGLDAQRAAVQQFCADRQCRVLAEFTEVESGRRNDRPQLKQAIEHAGLTGATLVIAKIDRLSRNAAFLLALRDSGVRFQTADLPDANDLTVGILALVAEQEREAISARTRSALAAARARGTRLGNPNGAAALRRAQRGNAAAVQSVKDRATRKAERLAPMIQTLRARGIQSLSAMAAELNRQEVEAPRGGEWRPTTVRRLLHRLEGSHERQGETAS